MKTVVWLYSFFMAIRNTSGVLHTSGRAWSLLPPQQSQSQG